MPAVQRVYQAVYHQSAFAAELQSSNQSSESCWLHHLWQQLMIETKPVSFHQASDSTKLKTGEMFWPKITRKSILTVLNTYGAAAVAQWYSSTLLLIKRF